MKGLRVQEIYGPTFQGEGPSTGKPTSFIRFASCNLRCPGWGVETTLPNGKVVVGCDTPRAVHPELYSGVGSKWMTPQEIVDALPEYPKRVCITGGEPLVQKTELFCELVDLLYERDFAIDLFTNGTKSLDPLGDSVDKITTITMDFKLPGSGEFGKFDYENFDLLTEDDVVKFVIKSREDYLQAKKVVEESRTDAQFWAGVVFEELSNDTLMDWMLEDKLDWRFQLQEHKYTNLYESELEKKLVDIEVKGTVSEVKGDG